VPWWTWLVALVSVALVGSIAVAVQRPGRARNVTAWLGAVGFYVPLVGMFGSWARASFEGGSWGGRIGFGFLAAMFSIGLVIAVFKTIGAARSRGPTEAGATH
jgi:hypothetical protein